MKDLKEILENHLRWLKGEDEGEQANLSGADLRRTSLCGANLCGANLYGANLYRADLSGANLYGANLSGADLRRTSLCGANLYGADLSGANLYGANLYGANLSGADLREADVSRANLSGADLRGARNVSSVLWDCNTAFYQIQCPESGSFVGWKKASNKIVKLEITENAKRSSATSRKCRCSEAKVLEIQNIDGSIYEAGVVSSDHCKDFKYKAGEIVRVENFDEDRWSECTFGIHFFITREEAVKY